MDSLGLSTKDRFPRRLATRQLSGGQSRMDRSERRPERDVLRASENLESTARTRKFPMQAISQLLYSSSIISLTSLAAAQETNRSNHLTLSYHDVGTSLVRAADTKFFDHEFVVHPLKRQPNTNSVQYCPCSQLARRPQDPIRHRMQSKTTCQDWRVPKSHFIHEGRQI